MLQTQLLAEVITVDAAEDIEQYRLINLDGHLAAATTPKVLGVSQIKATSGMPLSVALQGGLLFVTASAAIAAKAAICATTGGKAKTVSTAQGSTDVVQGYTLDEAKADGDLIRIILN